MITEDYVSFETAKLLKEKGFDWAESPFYSEQDRDEWRRNAWYSIPNPRYDENIPFDSPTLYVTAPHISIQMAMKWLREKHNKIIIPGIRVTDPIVGIIDCYYVGIYYIPKDNGGSLCFISPTPENGYSSYEEACKAAINYCLEKLI